MVDEKIVVHLLQAITRAQAHVTWKMKCTYTDGIEHRMYEIRLFHLPHSIDAPKIIAFQMGTGKLFGKGGISTPPHGADNVVDLLLDLLNAEREGNLQLPICD
jgi:hypothetical protein